MSDYVHDKDVAEEQHIEQLISEEQDRIAIKLRNLRNKGENIYEN